MALLYGLVGRLTAENSGFRPGQFADYVQFVDLLNCSNVQVVNFEFDLVPLPYTALVIDSVDPEA